MKFLKDVFIAHASGGSSNVAASSTSATSSTVVSGESLVVFAKPTI